MGWADGYDVTLLRLVVVTVMEKNTQPQENYHATPSAGFPRHQIRGTTRVESVGVGLLGGSDNPTPSFLLISR